VHEPGDEPSSSASQIGRYGGYGITLGLAVALFAWLGTLLDARWGTKPLFVLLGTFAGFGAGMYRMLRDLSGSQDAPSDRSGR
jgi:F0F1-type ATP synthase assembly protein I